MCSRWGSSQPIPPSIHRYFFILGEHITPTTNLFFESAILILVTLSIHRPIRWFLLMVERSHVLTLRDVLNDRFIIRVIHGKKNSERSFLIKSASPISFFCVTSAPHRSQPGWVKRPSLLQCGHTLDMWYVELTEGVHYKVSHYDRHRNVSGSETTWHSSRYITRPYQSDIGSNSESVSILSACRS